MWRSRSERGGVFHSIAACHWEMVVTRHAGRTSLTVRGPETRATEAECPAEGEWLAIRFRLGTSMPLLPPGMLRDRRDVTLPGAGGRSFWLQGSAVEVPTFENAEAFVERLVRREVVRDHPPVRDALAGERPSDGSRSVRNEQRRFLQVTGISRAAARSIERARRATWLLLAGTSILDTVFEAGYYDQPHLTRALRRWTGRSPGEVLRGERQLSFLYKT